MMEDPGCADAADYLNRLDVETAREVLLSCCGSERWARRMAEARPFASQAELVRTGDDAWWDLEPEDWLEAFAAHPRIGERDGKEWTAKEQSGMDGAPPALRRLLEAGNREYERKFGHVFLICATGLGGEEMLAALRHRLANDPETELREAAAEQAKITRLRIEKLT